MELSVPFKVILGGEKCTTGEAFEELVDGVNVASTMVGAGEGRRADGALVRFIQGVSTSVFLQITGLFKSLVANVANIWAFPFKLEKRYKRLTKHTLQTAAD